MGPPGFTSAPVTYTSIKVNDAGTPCLAFSDGAHAYRASLMTFNTGSSQWEYVGSAGFSDGAASYVALAINTATSQPYVVYSDAAHSLAAAVMTYSSGAWAPLGGSLSVSPGRADWTSISLATTGPFIAFSDYSVSQRLTVMMFTNGSWSYVGSAGFSSGAVRCCKANCMHTFCRVPSL